MCAHLLLQIASALPPRIPESETDDSSPKSLPAHDQASSHRHRLAGSGLGQSTFNANLRIATSQAQQSSGLSSAEGSPRNSPYRAGARELGLSQLGAARNPQGNLLTHPSVDKFRFEAGQFAAAHLSAGVHEFMHAETAELHSLQLPWHCTHLKRALQDQHSMLLCECH